MSSACQSFLKTSPSLHVACCVRSVCAQAVIGDMNHLVCGMGQSQLLQQRQVEVELLLRLDLSCVDTRAHAFKVVRAHPLDFCPHKLIFKARLSLCTWQRLFISTALLIWTALLSC